MLAEPARPSIPPEVLDVTEVDLGRCVCKRWPLYVGIYDRHGNTVRCVGCLRIPAECWCRR